MISKLLTAMVLVSSTGPGADDRNSPLVAELVLVVRDPSGGQSIWARVHAAETLGKLGAEGRSAVPALAAMLDDVARRDPTFLDEAIIRALAKMGYSARPAIPALIRVCWKEGDVERGALEAIDQILLSPPNGPGDLPTLMKDMRDRDPSMRLRAAKAITMMGTSAKAAIPLLVEALKDNDGDVRRQALKALRKIDPSAKAESEVTIYLDELRDPDPGVRLRAAKALGRLGAAGAGAAQGLLEATADSDPDVRRQATDALNRVQQP